jgi:hypothetical protein
MHERPQPATDNRQALTTNNVTVDQAIIADSVTTGGAARDNVASPALTGPIKIPQGALWSS